jgi:peroxiredoxin
MQARKVILATGLLGLCAALCAGLVSLATRMPDMRIPEVGAAIPRIQALDPSGKHTQVAAADRPTVLVVYRLGCRYCASQLSQMLHEIPSFSGSRLVLVRHAADASDAPLSLTVDALRRAGALTATMGGKEVAQRFGTLLTPATFVYDRQGRLASTFIGEVAPAKIAADASRLSKVRVNQ